MKVLNTFYDRRHQGACEYFKYDNKPVEYKGYSLYEYTSQESHIVKDNKVVGMCVTIRGCKQRIDKGRIQ